MSVQNKTSKIATISVIRKLRESINVLSESIDNSRSHLISKKGKVPEDVFNRLDSYEIVVAKQNKLVDRLEILVLSNPTDKEIPQVVQKINHLSLFIREDAKDLIQGFSGPTNLNSKKYMH